MKLKSPLIKATLLQRYKRFLADMRLEDGTEITAHCANPGAMLGLNTPGTMVWLSHSDDPKRKLKYSWELSQLPNGDLVGINTAHPNRIVEEALRARQIAPLAAYTTLQREVKYGQNSRIDFLLTADGLPDCYVEVKNVHLCRQETLAEFPDSVTKRGAKHLVELSHMRKQGHRAVMLYLIQRTDCTHFALAADIDPAYATAFSQAHTVGVEALAFRCNIGINPHRAGEITLDDPIPFSLKQVE